MKNYDIDQDQSKWMYDYEYSRNAGIVGNDGMVQQNQHQQQHQQQQSIHQIHNFQNLQIQSQSQNHPQGQNHTLQNQNLQNVQNHQNHQNLQNLQSIQPHPNIHVLHQYHPIPQLESQQLVNDPSEGYMLHSQNHMIPFDFGAPLASDPFQRNYMASSTDNNSIVTTKIMYNHDLQPGIVSANSEVSFDDMNMGMLQSPEMMGISIREDLSAPYPTPPDNLPLHGGNSLEFGDQRRASLSSPMLLNDASVLASSMTREPQPVKYNVVRGISSGGSAAKPPKVGVNSKIAYVPVKLSLTEAGVKNLCLPEWDEDEKNDKRRIIRIEKTQNAGCINANFSILGSAAANPTTAPPGPGVDVVEVSVLECYLRPGDDSDDEDDSSSGSPIVSNGWKRCFYITSVEVIKIVELLIGADSKPAFERRKERGRIRSNLVPFWSKKPVSTRIGSGSPVNSPVIDGDFRVELAQRIMGYTVRKPRGFDKNVRILKWEKLEPALKRALQTYYVEVPK